MKAVGGKVGSVVQNLERATVGEMSGGNAYALGNQQRCCLQLASP